MEQIVDFPNSGGSFFRPRQRSSSSSHVPAGVHEDADEPGEGFFRTFTKNQKMRSWVRTRVRGCPPVQLIHAGGSARGCARPIQSASVTWRSLISRPTLPRSGVRMRRRREGGRGRKRRKGGSGRGGRRLGDWVLPEEYWYWLWFDSGYLFIRQSCSCVSWTFFLRALVSGSFLFDVGLPVQRRSLDKETFHHRQLVVTVHPHSSNLRCEPTREFRHCRKPWIWHSRDQPQWPDSRR